MSERLLLLRDMLTLRTLAIAVYFEVSINITTSSCVQLQLSGKSSARSVVIPVLQYRKASLDTLPEVCRPCLC
jgi:hypothetical protein